MGLMFVGAWPHLKQRCRRRGLRLSLEGGCSSPSPSWGRTSGDGSLHGRVSLKVEVWVHLALWGLLLQDWALDCCEAAVDFIYHAKSCCPLAVFQGGPVGFLQH